MYFNILPNWKCLIDFFFFSNLAELDLNAANSFIQEFVRNPFLIDGRKFDIGIYTVVTSINPLRVYIVDDETLVRFCGKDYLPEDFNDVNKYVVTDDYTPMWLVKTKKFL